MEAEGANEKDDKRGALSAGRSSTPESDGSEVCATCGSSLQQWGAGGCLRCLIEFVSVPETEPAVEESAEPPTGKPVTKRYGHFEVATATDGRPFELGRGAMGTTFRAHDTVLDCAVALKIIDRSVAEHPAARARFLREARMAAKLRHPNVASVFQYGEQDGECFYTMELVDGETLEARVQRDGPLSAGLTMQILIEVTRALAAAEAHGVIHRDLKPTNLMLTARKGDDDAGLPVVKVIDFGLAKAVATDLGAAGATETRGGFVGTPAFASPEQFAHAENIGLDGRSDIYSLGATAWYALCGSVPFTGRSLQEIHARQHDQLPLEQLRTRGVPETLVTVVESMLSVEPAHRPQSASQLLEVLQRCRGVLSAVNQPAKNPWKFRVAMILTLLVAAAAATGVWKLREASRARTDDRSIAVLPFENLSPNPADAFFAKGMQDEIIGDLAHVSALKVIGPDSTRGYPPGKRDFTRIGRELGVNHLLTGDVRREGGQVRVNVQLIDTDDAAHPWKAAYVRPLEDVFFVQGEITSAIVDQLQTPLSAEEKNAINEPPTTDLVAYDLYLQVSETPEFNTSIDALFTTLAKQVTLLDAAVARDPKFVLAYCALAQVHDNFYQYRNYAPPEDRTVDHRALAETALQNARRLRPDAGEVHLAAANHFLLVNRDNEQARLELDLARRTLPNSASLENTAGSVARAQGRWEDALRAQNRALALDPRDASSRSDLALTYRLLRRYDDCEKETLRLLAILPALDAARARTDLGLDHLSRDADLAPLRASLAALPTAEYNVGNDLLALTLHLCEHDADAITRVLASSPSPKFMINGCIYPKGWFEALAARMRGDAAGARTAFAAARIDAEKAVAMDATNGLHLSMLAMIDAGLGRTDDAVQEGLRACEILPPSKSATRAVRVAINLAVVYAWTGKTDEAIAKLQELVRGPSGNSVPIQPSYGDFELNPIWDPLRNDPRFTALKKSLSPNASPAMPGVK